MPTPEEPKTAEAAVTAALAAIAPPSEETVVVPPESEEIVAPEGEVVETPEGEETAPEGEVVETPEGEETDEQKAEREAAEAAAAEGGAAKTPEQIAAEKAAKETVKKTLEDHVNDPISPQLKAETQDRIRTLANSVRELEPIRRQHEELVGRITDTGMSAEEFGMSLTYSSLIHSGDPVKIKQGYNILLSELKAIAPLIGETLPGTDPLAGHADLQDLVKNGKSTPELAAEVAKNRNQAAAQQRIQQQNQNVQETEAQWQHAKKTAEADLNALGAQLHAADKAGFKAKYDIIVPLLKPVFAELHPSKWRAAFERAWKQLPAVAPVAARVTPKPVNQPLRANKQPAGGASKQPATMQEAIQASLQRGK